MEDPPRQPNVNVSRPHHRCDHRDGPGHRRGLAARLEALEHIFQILCFIDTNKFIKVFVVATVVLISVLYTTIILCFYFLSFMSIIAVVVLVVLTSFLSFAKTGATSDVAAVVSPVNIADKATNNNMFFVYMVVFNIDSKQSISRVLKENC